MPNYRVRIATTGIAGAPYLTTFFFDQPTAQGAIDAADGYIAIVRTVQNTNVRSETEPEVIRYSTPDTPEAVESGVPAASQVGTQAGQLLPLQTQGLIRWRTGIFVGAREITGRTFIPGATVAQSTVLGVPIAAYITAMNSMSNALQVDGLHIASRTHNLFYEVSSGTPWSKFAVLRSRRD